MALRACDLTDGQGAVIYDSVTDTPLPLQLFSDQDAAEHFLLWAAHEGREPFGPSNHYHADALGESQSEWWDRYTDGGVLNATARIQLESESMEVGEEV